VSEPASVPESKDRPRGVLLKAAGLQVLTQALGTVLGGLMLAGLAALAGLITLDMVVLLVEE
jgi:hypothetical protein